MPTWPESITEARFRKRLYFAAAKMTHIHPLSVARRLYRGSRARRNAQEESRFRSRLRVEERASELVLSPHWDDAVLDCWSLLASSRELTVVNVFAGIPGPNRLTIWDATTG